MANWWDAPSDESAVAESAPTLLDTATLERQARQAQLAELLRPTPTSAEPSILSTLDSYRQAKAAAANPPPVIAAPAVPEDANRSRTWGEVGGDVLAGLARGATGITQGMANLADLATFGGVSALTKAGGSLADSLLGGRGEGYTLQEANREIGQAIEGMESAPLRQQRQQFARTLQETGTQGGVSGALDKFVTGAKETLTNPMLLGQFATEQVPMIATLGLGTIGTAAKAEAAAKAAGLTGQAVRDAGIRAAERANILASGVLGSGFSSQQAADAILNAPIEDLFKNEQYVELAKTLGDRGARAELARQAGYPAAAIAGPLSALAGRITAPLETRAFLGQLPKGITPALVAGGKEGLEEALQEPSEQFGSNVGERFAGMDKSLWEGLPEAAGQAGAAGFLMGLGLGGVNVLQNTRLEGQQAGATGEYAAKRLDQLSLAGLTDADLDTAIQQTQQVIATPKLPPALRDRLTAAMGRLNGDQQARANGDALRQAFGDYAAATAPEALVDLPADEQSRVLQEAAFGTLFAPRTRNTLVGMSAPDKLNQLNDAEMAQAGQVAVDAATLLARANQPELEPEIRSLLDAARTYSGELHQRRSAADLASEVTGPDGADRARALLDSVTRINGNAQQFLSPEYQRATLADDQLPRLLERGQTLLRLDADPAIPFNLAAPQRAALTTALGHLRAEQENRQTEGWQQRNQTLSQIETPKVKEVEAALTRKDVSTWLNDKSRGPQWLPALQGALDQADARIAYRQQIGATEADDYQRLVANRALLRQKIETLTAQAEQARKKAFDEDWRFAPGQASANEVTDDQGREWVRNKAGQWVPRSADQQRIHDLALQLDAQNRQQAAQSDVAPDWQQRQQAILDRETAFREQQQQASEERRFQQDQQRLEQQRQQGIRRAQLAAQMGLSPDELLQLSEVNTLRARAGLPSLTAAEFKAVRSTLQGSHPDGTPAMTQEEWNAATRFYRSGKSKNAETPSGERIILTSDVTEKTFREKSAEFLRKIRRNYIVSAIRDGKPVPQAVLDDYPDLAPKAITPASPVTPSPTPESPNEPNEANREPSTEAGSALGVRPGQGAGRRLALSAPRSPRRTVEALADAGRIVTIDEDAGLIEAVEEQVDPEDPSLIFTRLSVNRDRAQQLLVERDAALGLRFPGLEPGRLAEDLQIVPTYREAADPQRAADTETDDTADGNWRVSLAGEPERAHSVLIRAVRVDDIESQDQTLYAPAGPVYLGRGKNERDLESLVLYRVGEDATLYDFLDAIEQANARLVVRASAERNQATLDRYFTTADTRAPVWVAKDADGVVVDWSISREGLQRRQSDTGATLERMTKQDWQSRQQDTPIFEDIAQALERFGADDGTLETARQQVAGLKAELALWQKSRAEIPEYMPGGRYHVGVQKGIVELEKRLAEAQDTLAEITLQTPLTAPDGYQFKAEKKKGGRWYKFYSQAPNDREWKPMDGSVSGLDPQNALAYLQGIIQQEHQAAEVGSGSGVESEPAPTPALTLLQKAAIKVISEQYYGDAWRLAGPHNKELRRDLYQNLLDGTGQKATIANSGVGAIRDRLVELAGISKEGKAIVEWENELTDWMKNVLAAKGPVPAPRPAPTPAPAEPVAQESPLGPLDEALVQRWEATLKGQRREKDPQAVIAAAQKQLQEQITGWNTVRAESDKALQDAGTRPDGKPRQVANAALMKRSKNLADQADKLFQEIQDTRAFIAATERRYGLTQQPAPAPLTEAQQITEVEELLFDQLLSQVPMRHMLANDTNQLMVEVDLVRKEIGTLLAQWMVEQLDENPNADIGATVNRIYEDWQNADYAERMTRQLIATAKTMRQTAATVPAAPTTVETPIGPAQARPAGPGVTAIELPVGAATPAPTPAAPPARPADYGKGNTIFTEDAAAKARELLKRKLGQLNAGLDPELIQAGITLAGYHMEAGARAFADYAKAMISDLGEAARPFLRSFYEGVRHYPGFDKTGLTRSNDLDYSEKWEIWPGDTFRIKGQNKTVAWLNEHRVYFEDGTEVSAINLASAKPDWELVARVGAMPQEAAPITPNYGILSTESPALKEESHVNPTVTTATAADNRPGVAGSRPGAVSAPAPEPGTPDLSSESGRGNGGGVLRGQGRGDRGNAALSANPAGRGRGGLDPDPEPGVVAPNPGGLPGIPPTERSDYRLPLGGLTREGSWLATAQRNADILELAARIENEGRPATPDEQALLVKYVGFGAGEIRNKLFPPATPEELTQDPDANRRIRPAITRRYLQTTGISAAEQKRWIAVAERLERALTPDDQETLLRSTQYAHYTSESIIRSIWRAMEQFGFGGGKVLEPGMGIGSFALAMPEGIYRASQYVGVEMDGPTARIAKLLSPRQTINQADFTRQSLPRDYFDVAIGNPPFSRTIIESDPEYAARRFSLHDYFFAKSMDRVRPGGLVVFITSRHTLDKQNDKARTYLAERADFLGAIRLPQTAFSANAGTEVVTDVIFLRKRQPLDAPAGASWTGLDTLTTADGPVAVNEYFVAHPEMILGQPRLSGNRDDLNRYISGLHPGDFTVVSYDDSPAELEAQFAKAVETLPRNLYSPVLQDPETVRTVTAQRDFAPKTNREGALYLADNGTLMRVENGAGRPLSEVAPWLKPKQLPFVQDYLGLLQQVRATKLSQWEDGAWEQELAALNARYDAFRAQHGPLLAYTVQQRVAPEVKETWAALTVEERRWVFDAAKIPFQAWEKMTPETKRAIAQALSDQAALPAAIRDKLAERISEDNDLLSESRTFQNKRLLELDSDSSVAYALENINEQGDIVKAPFLKGRTIRPPQARTVATPQDALAVSLDRKGYLDLADVAGELDLDRDETLARLGTLVYQTPAGEWQLADEYLSGDVVTKLAEAELAARLNPALQRNVEALRDVQPMPKGIGSITVKIGAGWIEPRYIEQFAREALELPARVTFDPLTTTWQVRSEDTSGRRNERAVAHPYGVLNQLSPYEVLQAALRNTRITISDTVRNPDGSKATVTNTELTLRANELAKQIGEQFKAWVWRDGVRALDLVNTYNDRFNRLAGRKFDGSHLTLPGLSLRYVLHPHQKRAIWRIIQTGNTYLAHAVGAGKTLEQIVAGMEQRRLGLIRRPMYVVPNHMLEQFASEFMDAYPTANIMVASGKNFTGDNRRRFLAQAALNNPDAIILTHSSMKLIGMREETLAPVRRQILNDIQEAIAELGAGQDTRILRSRLEQQYEQAQQRFDKMIGSGDRSGTSIRFEDLGADFVFYDEAHEARKLDFTTGLQIKGIDPKGSWQALDLYVKTRWLEAQHPGRSFVFASGTPVTNTMGELFTVMRFFDEASLRQLNVHTFDAWAAMFGEEVMEYEPDATGVLKPVSRFSKFNNVPALMAQVRSFMDILTGTQLRSVVKNIPQIEGGAPAMLEADKSPDLNTYMQQVLAPRLEQSRRFKPSREEPGNPDPIMAINNDALLASIDLRFTNPALPSDPHSKLNRMIDEIITDYRAGADQIYRDRDGQPMVLPGSTQIVFYNVGFGEGVLNRRGFDARAWVNRRLKQAGIPLDQVAWFDDAKTAANKERVFRDVRAGKVRILLGSAKKMGTGVNVQNRLEVLHYLDPPWYPALVEQPFGRILRQGNQNPTIRIKLYGTKGTYEAAQWGLLARKMRFIEAALSGDSTIDSIEDVSAASVYEQATAAVAGDPRFKQLADLTNTIRKLETLRAAHQQNQAALHGRQRDLENSLDWKTRYARHWRVVEEELGEYAERAVFESGELNGKTYTKRNEFAEALFQEVNRRLPKLQDEGALAQLAQRPIQLGKLNGRFPIVLQGKAAGQYDTKELKLVVTVPSEEFWIRKHVGSDVETEFPLAQSGYDLGSALNKMSSSGQTRRSYEDEIRIAQEDLRRTMAQIGAPFPQEAELGRAIADRAALEQEMTEAKMPIPADDRLVAEAEARRIEHQEQAQRIAQATPTTPPQRFAIAATPASVRASLEAIAGDRIVQDLIDAGSLALVATQQDAVRRSQGRIQIPPGQRVGGAVDPETGTVYLIAEHIRPEDVAGLLRHEVAVHQRRLGLDQPKPRALRLAMALLRLTPARQWMGETTFAGVLDQMERMRKAGNVRVVAAFEQALKAMKALNQDVNNPQLVAEEALAYLVGDQANADLPLFRRILAAVRAFLTRAGFKLDLTTDDLVLLAQSALETAAQREVRAGAMTRGVFGAETTASLMDRFRKTGFISNRDVLGILGDYPQYLNTVAEYILSQHQKLIEGKVTPRDVAKAYLLTLASQRSDAINPAVIQARTGFVVPERFIDQNGKVRPEEATAAWLLSPNGKRALDAIEQGRLEPALWEEGLQIRDAFGANVPRNQAFTERTYQKNYGGKPRTETRQYNNLHEILAVTQAINAAKGDTQKLDVALRNMAGIGPGKTGFIKHFLGLGDTPTADAVEINTWLTGLGSVKGVETEAATLAREFSDKSDKPKLAEGFVSRIERRFNQLKDQTNIPEKYKDNRVYQHLMHHWLWERAKGLQTTHAGVYEAMLRAAIAQEDAEAARQYAEVVARYTNPDGSKKAGWLKAPNGQPTKLNERQWVQVRTPNTGAFSPVNPDIRYAYAGERAATGQYGVPWPTDFPNITPLSTIAKLKAHPEYLAAKTGDRAAAVRVISAIMQRDQQTKLRALAARYPDAIVVPVHAVERNGTNKIPRTFADFISELTGLSVDTSIVQTNKVGRTSQNTWHRLAFRPQFDGDVRPGARYLLVDDAVTGGGTFSELRQFIEGRGGRVVHLAAIGAAQFSAKIALSESTYQTLEARYGAENLERFLRDHSLYGGNPRALTESEARTLLGAGTLDAAGDRITAAIEQERLRSQSPGVQGAVAETTPDTVTPPSGGPQRFAIAIAPGTPPQMTLPPMTRVEVLRRAIQDRFLRFKTLQDWLKKTGINLTPDADVYGEEERSVKRFAAQAQDFRDQTLTPLVQAAGQAGYAVTGGDFIAALMDGQSLPARFKPSIPEYLIAQHAAERNRAIAKINPRYADPDQPGSGLTDAEAATILARYRALPNFAAFERMAEQFRAIAEGTKNLLLDAGILNAETVAAWDAAYQHYVPLKGGPDDAPAKQGTGPGNSVVARQRRAMGHDLRAENVLENIFRDRERALFNIEKNKVGQALKQFVEQANNPAIGTVGQPEKHATLIQGWLHEVWIEGRPLGAYQSYNDAKAAIAADSAATGRPVAQYGVRHKAVDPSVVYMTRPLLAENEAGVYINGELVRIQLNDEAAARAYNALGVDGAGGLLKVARSFNTFLSKAYTGYNPEFLLVNMARDLTAGTINLTGKYGAGFAAQALKHYVGSFREAWRFARDKGTHTWLDRYRQAGGSTGASYLSDLERMGGDIERTFEDAQGAVATWKAGKPGAAARVLSADVVRKVFGLIEAFNQAGENALRIATFRTVIEQGGSDAEAASAAANVTVNFNRRGEMTYPLGALYLFFNPNVQGTQVLLDTLLNSPHKRQAQAAAAGLVGLAFLLANLARGGDDEDEERWRRIPGYTKDRNLILQLGEKQVTVPLPYGYGMFWALGNVLSDLAHGADDGKAGVRLASALFEHFSPLGNPLLGETADIKNLAELMPTLLRMPTDIMINRGGLGSPIMPEVMPWNPGQPDSARRWRETTGGLMDRVTTGLNKLAGGSAYESSGALTDISPETLRYLWRGLTGGAGQFLSDTLGWGLTMAQGVVPELRETPGLRKFVRVETVQNARTLFSDQANQIREAVGAFNAAKRAQDSAGMFDLVREKAALIRLGSVLEQFQGLIKTRRQLHDLIQATDMPLPQKRLQLKTIEQEESKLYGLFSQIFRHSLK